MQHEKAMWPIIYVRGYAMSEGEIEATTADPFCGFNLGSTVYRATPDKKAPPRKFIFESPVVRLGADFGYACIFDAGADLFDPDWTKAWIPPRSIIIYRYYDEASRLLGSGETPPIEKFAEGLGTLILKVRDLVCADPQAEIARRDFRCYLIAHSMGGLVCRTFLQNPKHGDAEARKCVDKVFTFATPHNGIDVGGLNVPGWLTANDLDNFNRERMAKYLNLKHGKDARVDWLPEEAFPSERFFCMIGTNRSDYEAGFGLSRTFAGHRGGRSNADFRRGRCLTSLPYELEHDKADAALSHALGRVPERGDRMLRVIYNASVNPPRIVTAYFDRRVKGKT